MSFFCRVSAVILLSHFMLNNAYVNVNRLQWKKHTSVFRSAVSDQPSIRDEVMGLRASEIKRILTSISADTRALYDKEELGALLIKLEIESRGNGQKITSIPMPEVPLGNTPQTYVGIDIEINNNKIRFMVDTGATMNLIRPDVIKQLGLSSEQQTAYTVGLGGGGTVAARKCNIDNIRVGSKVISMEAAILDNPQSLPFTASGILGLSFLSSLGETVEFDFDNKVFKFGSRKAVLSPLEKSKFYEIKTRRIFSGLIATDIYINGQGTPYTAMVDMGSAHTIANSLAVKAVTGQELNDLPNSQNMCAGIDGKPVAMRNFNVNSVRVGDEFLAQSPMPPIYAADIPGMMQIGLGNSPSFILGIDVIGKNRLIFDIDSNRMYMKKKI